MKNTVGKNLKLPKNPKRSGYKFKGWFTKINGGDRVTRKTRVSVERGLFYARWHKG